MLKPKLDLKVGEGEGEAGGEGGIDVLSRGAVGPYDRVVLTACSVDDLQEWLEANGFMVPPAAAAKFRPYVEAGSAFVALKLLPDSTAGDVVPLRLSFRSVGGQFTIPILPASIAAEPDMRLAVHVLGDHRAIPLNYRHVVVNEALVDWWTEGFNYPEVVSQAVDEAGGRAFVTDHAGPLDPRVVSWLAPVSRDRLEQLDDASSFGELWTALGSDLVVRDSDVQRVLFSAIEDPAALQQSLRLECPLWWEWLPEGSRPDDCERLAELPLDGSGLADAIRVQVQEPRAHLAGLFEASPYLTRLFTTLSPEEMDTDPVFSFNPDLEAVPAIRRGRLRVSCTDDEREWEIQLADGRVLVEDEEGRLVEAEEESVGRSRSAGANKDTVAGGWRC